jgi:hypothetical protein
LIKNSDPWNPFGTPNIKQAGVSSKINQGIKITGIGCDEDQSGF